MEKEAGQTKGSDPVKKIYTSPSLIEWGTLADLTQGGLLEGYLDSDFTGTFNPGSTGHV